MSAALSMASTGGVSAPWDSDIEADPDPPDWTRNLDPDVVEKMSPKEKQRQEVVNGTPDLSYFYAFQLVCLASVAGRTSATRKWTPRLGLLDPTSGRADSIQMARGLLSGAKSRSKNGGAVFASDL